MVGLEVGVVELIPSELCLAGALRFIVVVGDPVVSEFLVGAIDAIALPGLKISSKNLPIFHTKFSSGK